MFSIRVECGKILLGEGILLRSSLLDANIIEPTLELREANAVYGAIFHVEDLP